MCDRLDIAVRCDEFIRGVKLAGLVGNALAAINQGDLIVRGTVGPEAAQEIPLTCLVPYPVSMFVSASAIRAARDDAAN